jgi:hypothetical protein
VRKARVDEIPPPFHPNHKSHETHRRTSSPAPPSSKGKRYELRGSEGGASWYHDYIDSLERHEGVNGGHCPTRRLLIGSTCLRRGRDFSPPPSLSTHSILPPTPFLIAAYELLLESMMMPTIRAQGQEPRTWAPSHLARGG